MERLEDQVHTLGSEAFREKVLELKDLGRVGRLKGDRLDFAFALAREACWRAVGKRPYPVQIMGAMAMNDGAVIEMATGEGKTLTAALSAAISSWSGKNVHVITVNDYLVERDAKLNAPIYELLGTTVGYVIHDTSPPNASTCTAAA